MLTWVILLALAAGAVWIVLDVLHIRRALRARRREELQENIRELELDLGIIEPVRNRDPMTDEPGRMIEAQSSEMAQMAHLWGPSPMDMAVARYLREDDPPPAHAAIPQWYDEYQRRQRMMRFQPVDTSDHLEVW